jgi:hypothetical protein
VCCRSKPAAEIEVPDPHAEGHAMALGWRAADLILAGARKAQ